MIRHTVAFHLVHPADSDPERAFLADGRRILTGIPGVADFAVSRQVGRKSAHHFRFAMSFPDQETYDAYSAHPDHTAFVAERWIPEVAGFEELDLVPYTDDVPA